jgi:hypothetical protein
VSPVEGGERPIGHAHLLAHLETHGRLRTLHAFLHLLQDALGFRFRNRHRLVVGAEEAGDLGRILDEVVRLIGHLHLHQHVAGEELALGVHLAAAANLDDLLGRHEDFVEQVRQAGRLGLLPDGVGNLALEVGIRVDDVPLLVHRGSHRAGCAGPRCISHQHLPHLQADTGIRCRCRAGT